MQKLYHFVAQPYLGKVAKAFRLVPSGLEMAAKRSAWGVILPPPLDHGKVKLKFFCFYIIIDTTVNNNNWFGDANTVTHLTKCNTNSKVRAMSA